jgi:small-conductance mechanosensitive channel
MLRYLIICLFIFSNLIVVAQPSVDSTYILVQQLLDKTEKQRILDSIKIAELKSAIDSKNTPQNKDLSIKLLEIQRDDSIKQAHQKSEIEQLKSIAKPSYVKLFADTLFAIYTPIGSYSPEQRAQDAHEKILALYDDDNYNADYFSLHPQMDLLNVHYKNDIIFSVTNYDALWYNQSMQQLANTYLQNVKFSIQKNKENYTWQNIALRWAQVLIIIIVAGALLKLLSFLFNKLRATLLSSSKIIKDVKIRNYELFDRKFILKVLLRFILGVRLLFVVLVIYFALSFVLNVFTATKVYTQTLWSWILNPVKELFFSIVNFIPQLLKIILIILVFRYVIYAFRYFSLEIEKGDLRIRYFHPEWARTTYQIIRILLIAFCIIFIFPYLPGSDTIAFKGISVFAGVLISFGSSSAISNSIAGFVITYMRPFKIGDWIKVGDDVGKVIDKTLLVTRIETIHNEDITIPNSTILNKHTINYSATKDNEGLIIKADVTMAYAIPWRQVHEVLLNAALATEHINKDKEPFVLQKTLDSYYVTYQINLYTKHPEKMYFIHTNLLQNIQDGFDNAGIDLHLPAQISIK